MHWDPISLAAIEAARGRLRGVAVRTPLVRLDHDAPGMEIYLKLESLQPVRSFKLRGAYNAMAMANPADLADGVWTVSSGNMGQAVAWSARALGVTATVYVPDTAPRIKLANIRRYGATPVELPQSEISPIWLTHRREGAPGRFIHPFSDPDVMAGNGTIGLELLEDLPEVDAVVIPYGGGGLTCGITSAIKAIRPCTRIVTSEMNTGAPFAPSFRAGRPVEVTYTPSFADAISDSAVNPEMLGLALRLVDHAAVVNREETAAAARLVMERNRVILEGAAATAVAVALSGQAGTGRIVCIVSGGNIDVDTLIAILHGQTPD